MINKPNLDDGTLLRYLLKWNKITREQLVDRVENKLGIGSPTTPTTKQTTFKRLHPQTGSELYRNELVWTTPTHIITTTTSGRILNITKIRSPRLSRKPQQTQQTQIEYRKRRTYAAQ